MPFRVTGSETSTSPSLREATLVGEGWCECRESNPDHQLRRRIHYPLCYTRREQAGEHSLPAGYFKLVLTKGGRRSPSGDGVGVETDAHPNRSTLSAPRRRPW